METRRTFIRNAGFASAALIISPGILSHSVKASSTKSDFLRCLGEQQTTKLTDQQFEILKLAGKAPSGHNTQPWLVEITSEKHWNIYLDSNALLPVVDPGNREALLSIGAFIENLVQAGTSMGFQVNYEITSDRHRPGKVAEVRLEKSSSIRGEVTALKTRRTLRNNYQEKAISNNDIRAVSKNITGFEYIPQGSALSSNIDELVFEAVKQQTFNDEANHELGKWIRWSNKEAEKYQTGLTPESMEMNGMVKFLAKHFFSAKDLLKNSFKKQTIKNTGKQLESHGGWVVLSSPDEEVGSLIETGRYFERMLLRIRSLNIAMHPMSQVLEEQPFKNKISGLLNNSQPIQFVIRTGYVNEYPMPVSLQKDVKRTLA